MINPHNLEVGQKLFRVTTLNRSHIGNNECWVTVSKVGRKWAYIEGSYHGERISLETLEVDGHGYASPGRCYLSEEEYREEAEVSSLWASLRQKMEYRPPQDIGSGDIRKAAELLGIDL